MIARFDCTTIDTPNPAAPWVSYVSDTSTATTPIQKSLPKTRALTNTSTKAASLFDTITITNALLLNLGGRYDRYETSVSPGLGATSTANARAWLRERPEPVPARDHVGDLRGNCPHSDYFVRIRGSAVGAKPSRVNIHTNPISSGAMQAEQ